MKIKSGRTGRARHRWVRNRRIQAAQEEAARLKHCWTCHKKTNGGIQTFVVDKTKTIKVIKVECLGCDLRSRVNEYRKNKGLDNTLLRNANFFVSDEISLAEDWMQADWRAEQRAGVRKRITNSSEYALEYRQISAAEQDICNAIDQMAKTVWSGWLQVYYRQSSARGHSCVIDGTEILIWGCAGRVTMTINGKSNEDLSVIFDESSTEPSAGLLSIHATKEQAITLLNALTENSLKFQADIKPNPTVGMF